MKFNPHPYQTHILEHILDVPRCAVWAGMGMGKTSSTLTALYHLDLVEPGPTLVIAPKRVALNTWPDEVAKWDHTRDMTISTILGTPGDRRAALRRKADIYTINYENLPWLIETLEGKWPFTKVVPDEATRLKSFRIRQGGKRAQMLGRVAHRTARFIELTGTPSPNGLQDLWGQAWFLDKGERLGRSFEAFKERWFQSERVGEDAFAIRLIPRPFAQEQIQDKLRDLTISLDPKDWFDLKEPIVCTVRVTLPRKARAIYDEMEKQMFAQIDGHDVEAFAAAAKTIKCLQIANGACIVDDKGTWKEVHDAKLEALESIVEEAAGAPVLVAYHFKSDLSRLQRAFPKGRTLDASPDTIRDWNRGAIPLLFAHPASAGHGLNLQDGGNILVFFGHWWDLEQYQQIIERIGPVRQLQAGHDRPVWIYHIVAHDTVDEDVMARRESKRSVQDILLESMKRRGMK